MFALTNRMTWAHHIPGRKIEDDVIGFTSSVNPVDEIVTMS